MVRFSWTNALLIVSPVVAAQSTGATKTYSVQTETINGKTSTYSVAFTLPPDTDNGEPVRPNIADPQAKRAQNYCPGYKATNVSHTVTGMTATLNLAGPACNMYGNDVQTLSFLLDVQSADRMRILIQPAHLTSKNTSWFVLPADLVPLPQSDSNSSHAQDIDLQFSYTNTPSFAFTVLRKSTGDILFDTRGSKLVYEDQYLEFVTQLPRNYNLYGLGERIHGLRLGNNYTATFWAADNGDTIDRNIYGNHAVYLDTRYYEVNQTTGQRTLVTTQNTSASGHYESFTHGMWLRNSHGMEVLMNPTNLTWRALGGSMDLYFLDGPTATEVTQQYHNEIVGLPAMQQYWTFGFHQCRWGYKNWSMVADVVENYQNFNIPLETVWTDIDYMFQYRDFTNDPNTFAYPEGQALLSRLHANGQHYVPIVDSAIYIPNPNNASDNYSIYTEGHTRDVFMKNPDGSEYIGAVWPGYTVFPDWHAANATSWWTNGMMSHHQNIPWDGIWIDMSEVSSFCVGSCGSGNLSLNPIHSTSLPGEHGNQIFDYPEGFNRTNATEAKIAASLSASQSAYLATASPSSSSRPYVAATKPTPGVRNVVDPPYVINNVLGSLDVHAVSPNATHADGIEEYDVHNLFGHQILNATYHALLSVFPGKRPFIIGRSTFAGSGVWAGHWGGDNTSLFAYMYFSIAQALNFGLFGFPMFGVDTCGFNGNSDEELCNRWMQLSAFFPFYRNHNTLSANPQEAYRWSSVAQATRTAMQIRYSLLPYLYTLFHAAHSTGSTVMRALAWEFPNDPTLAAIDHQFLLGPALMVVPVLGQGLTSRGGVFPGVAQGQVWYDWYTQKAVSVKPGQNLTIPAPLGHIPVYIRGGHVLPQQEARYTTTLSRNTSWSLICALDANGASTGSIYIDDGESVAPPATLQVDLTASNGTLYAASRGLYVDRNTLANVTVLGVPTPPTTVTFNGNQISGGIAYNSTSKALRVKGLQSQTPHGAWASDWTLSWS